MHMYTITSLDFEQSRSCSVLHRWKRAGIALAWLWHIQLFFGCVNWFFFKFFFHWIRRLKAILQVLFHRRTLQHFNKWEFVHYTKCFKRIQFTYIIYQESNIFFFVVETNKSTAQDKALACLLTRISFEWQTKITSLELIAFERSILLLIIIS